MNRSAVPRRVFFLPNTVSRKDEKPHPTGIGDTVIPQIKISCLCISPYAIFTNIHGCCNIIAGCNLLKAKRHFFPPIFMGSFPRFGVILTPFSSSKCLLINCQKKFCGWWLAFMKYALEWTSSVLDSSVMAGCYFLQSHQAQIKQWTSRTKNQKKRTV